MKARLGVLAASFAFAGAALAQSNDPQPRQTPRAPQQNPQQHPQQMPPRQPHNDTQSGQGGSGTMAPTDFATLDTRGVGYVTHQDVSSNTWMTRNFARCDADGNAQVSRAEFQRYAQRTGGPGQR